MTKIDRESVEQALAELEDVVRCRCHEAYTGRGLHDPDCQCDSADAVAIVRAALDEAEARAVKFEKAWLECEGLRSEAEARADALAEKLAEAEARVRAEVVRSMTEASIYALKCEISRHEALGNGAVVEALREMLDRERAASTEGEG